MPAISTNSRRSFTSLERHLQAGLCRGSRPVVVALAAALAVVLSACGGIDEAGAVVSAASSASGGVMGLSASATTIPAGGMVTVTVALADAARSASGAVTVYVGFPRSVLAGPTVLRIPNGRSTGTVTLWTNPFLPAATTARVTVSTSSPDPFSLVSLQLGVAAAAPAPATPRVDVAAVAFAPATVSSGTAATGTVTLTGAAPAGGAVVQLSNPTDLFGQIAEVPATVVVPEGTSSVTFTAPTHLAAPATQVSLPITGSSFGGAWHGSWLTVTAP